MLDTQYNPGVANGAKYDLSKLDSTGASNGDVVTFSSTSGHAEWANPTGGSAVLTQAHIFVGDVSNLAQDVAMSADATIDDTGAVTVTAINGVTIDSTATDANILVADGSQFNSVAMSGDVTIDNAGVTTVALTLNSGDILVGNVSNVATGVTMSGDATIDNAGAITVASAAGNFTLNAILIESVGANAVAPSSLNVTFGVLELTTAGTGDAFVLPDGVAGQTLKLVYIAEGAGTDTAIITPTNMGGGNTIVTFNAVGDTAEMFFSTDGNWYFLNGSAVAS